VPSKDFANQPSFFLPLLLKQANTFFFFPKPGGGPPVHGLLQSHFFFLNSISTLSQLFSLGINEFLLPMEARVCERKVDLFLRNPAELASMIELNFALFPLFFPSP